MGQNTSSGSETPRSARHKSHPSATSELLTHRQKTVLQKSWKKSNRTGLDNIGAQIFYKIYLRDPSVGNMFGLQNVPLTELKYHRFFQSHAMTFTRSLDFIVNNLEDMRRIRQFCRRLGKIHVNFIERGFKPEYWDIFAESLTECAIDWEGGLRCRDILVGWRTLINFVIEEMRVAFVKERRARNASICGITDSPNGSASSTTSNQMLYHSTDLLHANNSWDSAECPVFFDDRSDNRRRATSLQPALRTCPYNVH